jgi:hypothetical protein
MRLKIMSSNWVQTAVQAVRRALCSCHASPLGTSPLRATRSSGWIHGADLTRLRQARPSKAEMVEIARRYANRGELTVDLRRAAEKLAKAAGKRKPSEDRTNRPGQMPSVLERLEPEGIAQLIADYQAAETSTALTEKYEVGKGTVLRLLREHGATMRRQPISAEDAVTAIELYQQGWSLGRIGEHFGREHTAIRDVLERAGVPRRDSHGRERPAGPSSSRS